MHEKSATLGVIIHMAVTFVCDKDIGFLFSKHSYRFKMMTERHHPRFTWQLTNPYHEPYGWIKDHGRVVHNITNLSEFYLVLSQYGYKKPIATLPVNKLKPEFPADDEHHSDHLLQEGIMNYLRKHSSTFAG